LESGEMVKEKSHSSASTPTLGGALFPSTPQSFGDLWAFRRLRRQNADQIVKTMRGLLTILRRPGFSDCGKRGKILPTFRLN
jgi:hypothetical protein